LSRRLTLAFFPFWFVPSIALKLGRKQVKKTLIFIKIGVPLWNCTPSATRILVPLSIGALWRSGG
jgi:hypothetical protein